MKQWLKSLVEKLVGDPTAINCEVYVHKESSELFVVNNKGEVEADLSVLTTFFKDLLSRDLQINLDRSKVEYLGKL